MAAIVVDVRMQYFKAMDHVTKTPSKKGLYLDLVLMPSRSLSQNGFRILMLAMALISMAIGGFFLSIGAWPVFGFLGLDILLLYWAFKSSFHAGRTYEHICLTDKNLTVTRTKPNGEQERFKFGAAWVQIMVENPTPYQKILRLVERGHSLIIGTFLPPGERQSVAQIIQAGLDRRKALLSQV